MWRKKLETRGTAVKQSPDTWLSARRDAVHIVKSTLDNIAKLLKDMEGWHRK